MEFHGAFRAPRGDILADSFATARLTANQINRPGFRIIKYDRGTGFKLTLNCGNLLFQSALENAVVSPFTQDVGLDHTAQCRH